MLDSVYLSEPFTNALIAGAWDENRVTTYSERNEHERTKYEREFLNEYLPARDYRQKSLQELVLRENVYLDPSFDEFVTEPLEERGIVKRPESARVHDVSSSEFLRSGLVPVAVRYLRNQGHDVTVNEIRRELENDFIERYQEIASLTTQYRGELLAAKIEDVQLPEEERTQLEDAISEGEAIQEQYWEIYMGIREVWNLYRRSDELESPVLWDVSVDTETENLELAEANDQKYTVASIYFDELKSVKLDSLGDAIELRDNVHVQDFRKEVRDAVEGIKDNELTENEVRNRIRSANRALDRVETAKQVAPILTITPVLVPPEAIPAYVSTVGIGSVAYSRYLEDKYSWAFTTRY